MEDKVKLYGIRQSNNALSWHAEPRIYDIEMGEVRWAEYEVEVIESNAKEYVRPKCEHDLETYMDYRCKLCGDIFKPEILRNMSRDEELISLKT